MSKVTMHLPPQTVRKVSVWCLVYSFVLPLFFALGNTSFSIMGVDVGTFLLSYFTQFYGLALLAFSKILFLSIVFHFTFAWAIAFSLVSIFPSLAGFWKLTLTTLLLLLGLESIAWVHSCIQFPQLYGEFFFHTYPRLSSFQFFLTENVPPILPLGLVLFSLLGIYISAWVGYKKNRTPESVYFLFYIHFLYLFHKEGWIWGLFFLSLSILYFFKRKEFRFEVLWQKVLLVVWTTLFLLSNQSYLRQWIPIPNPPSPYVFLISADSLRPDRLGFVSGNSEITPNLDQFSKEAIIFQDHHTTIPRTFPSWTDLLTGHYSMSHKIRDMFPSPDEKGRIGSSEFPALPQLLKQKSYQSIAIGSFAGDIFPRANFGFDSVLAPNFNAKIMTVQRTLESQLFLLSVVTGSFGFGGTYLSEADGLSTWGDGARLVDRFKKSLRLRGKDPLFVTYFSSVIHFPYSPAYPHYKKFTDPSYFGKYKYLKFVDPTNSDKPNQKEIQQIRGLFDSSIYAFDCEFGEIISFLKDLKIYDNSLILVTADHGEALYEGEHGQGHGEHLRGESVTKVPLLLKLPKNHPKANHNSQSYSGITSSIDIAPTLLSLLDIPIVKKSFPGEDLLELLEKEFPLRERAVYSETGIWFSDRGDQFFQKQRIPYPNILELHRVVAEEDYQIMITDPTYRETIAFAKHRAILTSDYKLIYIPTRESVVWELYDRKKDPLNQQNIYPLGSVGPRLKQILYETVQTAEKAKVVGEYLLPHPLSDF